MSDSQYFQSTPQVASAPAEVDVVLGDVAFTITTDRGVFSHQGLDAGTRLLLTQGPELPETGVMLDLGCGAGPVAITMALRRPNARVWAIDVNQRALALTQANARRAGADNVEVSHPDDVPATVRFDAIWSNPAIRIGKTALHHMLARWLSRLNGPPASAVLVVSKHLGADSLATWLGDHHWPTTRLASRAGYRLLEVRSEASISPGDVGQAHSPGDESSPARGDQA
jgi:16S rRNA (guanine1207-N2)-methyltransferase